MKKKNKGFSPTKDQDYSFTTSFKKKIVPELAIFCLGYCGTSLAINLHQSPDSYHC